EAGDRARGGAKTGNLPRPGERRERPGRGGRADGGPPASLAEPPGPHRLRHAARHRRVLTRQTAGDRRPKPLPMLPPGHRRATRRPHWRASPPCRCPPSWPPPAPTPRPRGFGDRLNPPPTPYSGWWGPQRAAVGPTPPA